MYEGGTNIVQVGIVQRVQIFGIDGSKLGAELAEERSRRRLHMGIGQRTLQMWRGPNNHATSHEVNMEYTFEH